MVLEYTEAALNDLEQIMDYYVRSFGPPSALKVYRQIQKCLLSFTVQIRMKAKHIFIILLIPSRTIPICFPI